ncbi:MAG: hypothetical protein J6T64_09540, partial [Bacteroidaceae bacterium]|nr:hypothetical protein [Bacteroidaceae bacterium]
HGDSGASMSPFFVFHAVTIPLQGRFFPFSDNAKMGKMSLSCKRKRRFLSFFFHSFPFSLKENLLFFSIHAFTLRDMTYRCICFAFHVVF